MYQACASFFSSVVMDDMIFAVGERSDAFLLNGVQCYEETSNERFSAGTMNNYELGRSAYVVASLPNVCDYIRRQKVTVTEKQRQELLAEESVEQGTVTEDREEERIKVEEERQEQRIRVYHQEEWGTELNNIKDADVLIVCTLICPVMIFLFSVYFYYMLRIKLHLRNNADSDWLLDLFALRDYSHNKSGHTLALAVP
jgi:hypothetical protein